MKNLLPVLSEKECVRDFWEQLKGYGVQENMEDPDAILVAAGDGTFLGAQRKYHALKRPFIGVGWGSINFLLNRTVRDPKIFYERLMADEWKRFRSQGIHAKIISNDGVEEGVAFNDVYIKAMDPTSVVGIELNTIEYKDLNVSGDGLIIATPQGSTAYNRTAGGTILPLGSTLWGLTGICTQNRLRVTMQHQEVHLRIIRGDALAVVDNQLFSHVREVIISPSDHFTEICFDPQENFEQRRYNEL